MDKYFISLANSYKRGGRCVAGIEIEYQSLNDWAIVKTIDDVPQWIRPLAGTKYGEIPVNEATILNPFTIVKVCNVEPCPHNVHTEDVYYSSMHIVGQIEPSVELLDQFIDFMHRSPFGNHGKALKAEKDTGTNYSLMLIRLERAVVDNEDVWGKKKTKITFDYNGYSYSLPITDPSFLAWYRSHGEKRTELSETYIVLSLGLEYEGWYHKLVAAVLRMPEEKMHTHIAPKPYLTDTDPECGDNKVSEERTEYKPLSIWKKFRNLFERLIQ